MSDVFADGKVKVAVVTSISNIGAPTVAELNAGTDVTEKITADGLVGFEATTAEVDTTSLASTFNTKGIGRDDYSGTMLRLKKQTVGADTVRSLLVRGLETHVVVRRGIDWDTAWAADQEIEVYPVICGRRKELPPEASSVMKYEVPTPIRSAPDPDATVAA